MCEGDPLTDWPPPREIQYCLRGPQVEPEASFWSPTDADDDVCPPLCAVTVSDLRPYTDDPLSPAYFPEYPSDAQTEAEIEELLELASLRDTPGALFSNVAGRERLGLSPFLTLRPQPFGAVINTLRAPRAPGSSGRGDEPGASAAFRPDLFGAMLNPPGDLDAPVIATGRELARYFESETPGLAHRLALNSLIADANWSPPRQARVWMALDVAIYSALQAAWYYKWRAIGRNRVARRPRPIEFDYRVSVLYDRAVNSTGSGDGVRRQLPHPSPGTPRHPSYPSGHSTYAGAASEILSYFFPDYTEEFDRLADNTGMARLWAGIHYRSDHVCGLKLGRVVARLVINQLERGCVSRFPDPCDVTTESAMKCKDLPPTIETLNEAAAAFADCCEELQDHAPNVDGVDYRNRCARASMADRGRDGGAPAARTGTRPRRTATRSGAGAAASTVESESETVDQARGPQEGAPPAGSEQAVREQATGPQEGAPSAGSDTAARDRARSPQEGAH